MSITRDRISPKEIVKAYRSLPGTNPVQAEFVTSSIGEFHGCCGLSALALAEHPESFQPGRLRGMEIMPARREIANTLGISVSYTIGFIQGWDAAGIYTIRDIEEAEMTVDNYDTYQLGYKDGVLAWETASRLCG